MSRHALASPDPLVSSAPFLCAESHPPSSDMSGHLSGCDVIVSFRVIHASAGELALPALTARPRRTGAESASATASSSSKHSSATCSSSSPRPRSHRLCIRTGWPRMSRRILSKTRPGYRPRASLRRPLRMLPCRPQDMRPCLSTGKTVPGLQRPRSTAVCVHTRMVPVTSGVSTGSPS